MCLVISSSTMAIVNVFFISSFLTNYDALTHVIRFFEYVRLRNSISYD